MVDRRKLGERLLGAGLISPGDLAKAIELQSTSLGMRLGDCLLTLGVVGELSVLRALAEEFDTRYVASDKLAKLKIDPRVLEQIPVRFAESQLIFPLLFDADRRSLTAVMAEPQNVAAIEELKLIANLTDAVVFVGTRSALQAAIKKHYYGDASGFDDLSRGPARPVERPEERSEPMSWRPRNAASPSAAEPSLSLGPPLAMSASDAPLGGPTSVRQAVEAVQRSSLLSDDDYLETLNVLVGLLELRRKDAFRTHSAAVAKHARLIAQRLGLSPREVSHVTIAAFLHDLGKRPDRHHTLLAAYASAEWKADARRYLRAPIRLFETVHLPVEVNAILAQLFEAYDGSGFPQAVKAEAIPAGARILAAVDSFQDLTRNPQNTFGRVYGKEEALEAMRAAVGTLFDPAVVDQMEQIQSGEVLRERLRSAGHALICCADEGMRTDLRDALSKLGLLATAIGASEGALEVLQRGEADLFICDANLDPDAFTVLAALRREPAVAGLPAIVLTFSHDASVSERALGLRPCEVLACAEPDAIAAKAKELHERRQAGGAPGHSVAGSLGEMGLAELLRTLARARCSGRLALRSAHRAGELHLDKGRVVHAVCGAARPKEALEQLLGTGDGDFTFDPNFLALELSVDKDAEVIARELDALEGSTAVVNK